MSDKDEYGDNMAKIAILVMDFFLLGMLVGMAIAGELI